MCKPSGEYKLKLGMVSPYAANWITDKTRRRSNLSRIQIKLKQPDNMSKLVLTNSRTVCAPVFHWHDKVG